MDTFKEETIMETPQLITREEVFSNAEDFARQFQAEKDMRLEAYKRMTAGQRETFWSVFKRLFLTVN